MANKKGTTGSDAIGKAVAHFQSMSVRTIEVEEWGSKEEPFIIYVEPFTLKEQGRLQRSQKTQTDSGVLADVLILKALDKDGNNLFTLEDKPKLQNQVDARIIADIATKIMNVDIEEVEKN